MTKGKDSRRGRDPAKPAAERSGAKGDGRKRLGDNLRRMYDEVVSEPVPQEMLDLLARLAESSRKDPS